MLSLKGMMQKKVMLLTVTAGEGHNSAMKTIKAKLENEAVQVKVVNVFAEHSNAFKYHMINEGYLFLSKYFRPLFNYFFAKSISRHPEKRNRSVIHGFLKNETASFLKDILDFKPDVIFATHIFGAIMAVNLKRTYDLPYKIIFQVTDCMVYPYTECAVYVDKIIIPYASLTNKFLQVGYDTNQILPYGIPVKEKFYQGEKLTKVDYRKKLNLVENIFTVMLMLGGGGSADMIRIFKQVVKVKTPIQILIVCGKDVKTKRRIKRYLIKHQLIHHVINYGFVSNVEELMGASDLLLGKCGGLSSTEAIGKGLPLMVTTKLLIQEIFNHDFLLEHQAAVALKKHETVADKIQECMTNPEILMTVKKNLALVGNHDILDNIYRAIDELGVATYTTTHDALKINRKQQIKKHVKKMLKCADKN